MPTYTKTATDVINSVIQDSQTRTTNRNALLDYTNRVSLRILRESQWAFLQSEYQKFITVPGVDTYWIGQGAAPTGIANTGLNLNDVESVLPDTVYDLTNGRQLSSESYKVEYSVPFLQRDGSFKQGQPRGFVQSINKNSIIRLFPVPDGNNSYTPVPLASICTQTPGGVMPGRTYYLQTTLTDTLGNEGTPSATFLQDIQGGYIINVASPATEVPSGRASSYSGWNVYISTSPTGPFYRQNITPIAIGTSWVEPALGLVTNLTPPTNLSISRLWMLAISTTGTLSSVPPVANLGATPLYVTDSASQVWQVVTDIDGRLMTVQTTKTPVANPVVQDSAGTAWLIYPDTSGTLHTTNVGAASSYTRPSPVPPATSTLVPLSGYVIGFRYQKPRVLINSLSSPLQIPDAYFDVVVAGVNYYASLYLALGDDENVKAPVWKTEFLQGLAQIRRDVRQNYRNTDFISPDPGTQMYPSTGPWSWSAS